MADMVAAVMREETTCEDAIYIPIVEQFERENPDLEIVARKIAEVYNKKGRNGCKETGREIMRNVLLLVLGLFYREIPVDDFGLEPGLLDPEAREAFVKNLLTVFG